MVTSRARFHGELAGHISDPERKILRFSGEVAILYEKHLQV